MQKIKFRFTTLEDTIIISCISNNPTNLKHAFQEASTQLPSRNPETICAYWYRVLRHGDNVVCTGSSIGFKSNTKNTPRVDGVMPEVELQPYLVVLQELLKLSKKERDAIVNLLTIGNKKA